VVGNVAVTSINRQHDTGWVSYWTIEGHADEAPQEPRPQRLPTGR
jgi:hypothetical protein